MNRCVCNTVRREDLKRIGCCTLLPAIRWVHDSTNTLPVKGINRSMELVDRERCSHLSRLFNAASIFEMGGFWAYSLTAVASAATSPVFVSQFLMASLQLVMLLRSVSWFCRYFGGHVESLQMRHVFFISCQADPSCSFCQPCCPFWPALRPNP